MTVGTAGRNVATLTGGEAIVDALIANGTTTLFGLPGAQMYPLFDALHRRSAEIRTVGARHEQGCAYAAFGYARSTGRPGIFSVVPGPGVLNATAALATAAGCCAPVLCVTGQIPSAFIGKGRGHLHELPDQLATLRSVCKWAERIERVEDAPAIMNEAFRQMTSGRPGPVAIEMAWDVMAARAEVTPLPPTVRDPAPLPDAQAIDRAADLLIGAKQPMLFVGTGAQDATADVRELADLLGAPVTALRGGRGIVPENDDLGLSSYAAWTLWPTVDVVLGIGTRLELPFMRWTGMMTMIDGPETPAVIRIDIDHAEMTRLRPHVPIVADAGAGVRALIAALRAKGARRRDMTPLTQVRERARKTTATVTPHVDYLAAIRSCLPPDGFFVEELCQAGFVSYFAWETPAPRTYVSAGFQGTLGFGFMTALGVKVAHPDHAVVSISGDGGFLFGASELATAVQYGLGVVAIVFNNAAYGNVVRDQTTGFEGRLIGSELVNPDFPALARAFGVTAHRVNTPDGLRAILPEALASNSPALIEVVVDRRTETNPWPFIHPKR